MTWPLCIQAGRSPNLEPSSRTGTSDSTFATTFDAYTRWPSEKVCLGSLNTDHLRFVTTDTQVWEFGGSRIWLENLALLDVGRAFVLFSAVSPGIGLSVGSTSTSNWSVGNSFTSLFSILWSSTWKSHTCLSINSVPSNASTGKESNPIIGYLLPWRRRVLLSILVLLFLNLSRSRISGGCLSVVSRRPRTSVGSRMFDEIRVGAVTITTVMRQTYEVKPLMST